MEESIMSLEQNKALYRRYIQEVFNEGRLEALATLLSPDYIYHDAPPDIPKGRAAIEHVVTMFRGAFPDFEITIEEQIAEGDKVCSRATSRGTHRGPIFGIPATGKKIEMRGITIVSIANERITGSWVKNDVMGFMKQLGVGAPPPKRP
jgi:steroid delta-isomerase-like uncharacterized protein